MPESVHITTGSRLHFGPLFNGRTAGRRFGGVGLMIDGPACRVSVSRSVQDELIAAEDVRSTIERGLQEIRNAVGDFDPMRIEIVESIPRHRGLGSGTQMMLAVAQGILALRDGRSANAMSPACITRRGLRSAIGIHGFQQGGFLIDAGKRSGDSIGTLAARCEIPEEWRFVLIAPREGTGLSGGSESDAFSQLPAMPSATSAELCRIALTELLPAVRDAEFSVFADALFEYGRIVGDYFAPVQGGCFSCPEMSRLASQLRRDGFAGVAQSSWGPTIAVVTADHDTACQLAGAINPEGKRRERWCRISRPRNTGALIEPVNRSPGRK